VGSGDHLIFHRLPSTPPSTPGTNLHTPGLPWDSLDVPGLPWDSLDAFGLPWDSLDAPGLPWDSLDAPGPLVSGPASLYLIEMCGQVTHTHQENIGNIATYFINFLSNILCKGINKYLFNPFFTFTVEHLSYLSKGSSHRIL